ncbi:valine dehydrogenase [Saccharothrix sp. S26]|uniref:Leu/Phe/Val dehydrogenase n=1 Tax=Saccharothrix sp. S26 TaxID=2907215 RepID=UPI001F4658F5|nr:Glu/Leu/Phe/Val dehydrogenase dimerization domain-containing protein [Saccharothrix sp. S26]MCE7000797.1 valine dehydrogenase [Saccharothrix sp. S26]
MSSFSVSAPTAVLGSAGFEHEKVILCQDRASGLKAVIAIHSTALGPALGGTRFRAYGSDEEAIVDVLNLSRGMSYKNAVAGLDFGGGKAVIIGDPVRVKSKELLLAFGQFVASLGGSYVTGSDLGTTTSDMDVVARVCQWTAGLSRVVDGVGETALHTARGVLNGMKAAAHHRWGTSSLRGRTVGVAGLGKVGRPLVELLVREGATVVVTDVLGEAVSRVTGRLREVVAVDDTDTLVRIPGLDVYAPCALGATLNDDVAPVITAKVVCGAANNQLAHPRVERLLADRGVLYVPDYVANAGGVIQAAGQLRGHSALDTSLKVEKIFDTTLAVLARAASTGMLPGEAADGIAEQRITAAAGTRPSGAKP